MRMWILGWIYLIEGVVRVLTLGLVKPHIVLPASKWVSRKRNWRC